MARFGGCILLAWAYFSTKNRCFFSTKNRCRLPKIGAAHLKRQLWHLAGTTMFMDQLPSK